MLCRKFCRSKFVFLFSCSCSPSDSDRLSHVAVGCGGLGPPYVIHPATDKQVHAGWHRRHLFCYRVCTFFQIWTLLNCKDPVIGDHSQHWRQRRNASRFADSYGTVYVYVTPHACPLHLVLYRLLLNGSVVLPCLATPRHAFGMTILNLTVAAAIPFGFDKLRLRLDSS